jgi:predicted unusual protein kinase regulating ubiquinone biosynthesis (AarF/ABC1/UbiB family)
LINQTDFLQEIKNMESIKKNCKYLKYIKIPSSRKEITEKYGSMIVMEYIKGMKMEKVEEADYEEFAKQIIKFGLITTIIHGQTHGDLHCGNILFIKDNTDKKYPYKLGIIDFGIIFEIDSKYRNLLLNLLLEFFIIPPHESAIKILKSGIIEPGNFMDIISRENYNNILKFTEEIIDEVIKYKEKANQIQIFKFLVKLNDYLKKKELQNIGIKPSDNFIKTQLVIAMAHGITLKLCKGDFFCLMDKILNETFHIDMLEN